MGTELQAIKNRMDKMYAVMHAFSIANTDTLAFMKDLHLRLKELEKKGGECRDLHRIGHARLKEMEKKVGK